jgi:hypothetical protein
MNIFLNTTTIVPKFNKDSMTLFTFKSKGFPTRYSTINTELLRIYLTEMKPKKAITFDEKWTWVHENLKTQFREIYIDEIKIGKGWYRFNPYLEVQIDSLIYKSINDGSYGIIKFDKVDYEYKHEIQLVHSESVDVIHSFDYEFDKDGAHYKLHVPWLGSSRTETYDAKKGTVYLSKNGHPIITKQNRSSAQYGCLNDMYYFLLTAHENKNLTTQPLQLKLVEQFIGYENDSLYWENQRIIVDTAKWRALISQLEEVTQHRKIEGTWVAHDTTFVFDENYYGSLSIYPVQTVCADGKPNSLCTDYETKFFYRFGVKKLEQFGQAVTKPFISKVPENERTTFYNRSLCTLTILNLTDTHLEVELIDPKFAEKKIIHFTKK